MQRALEDVDAPTLIYCTLHTRDVDVIDAWPCCTTWTLQFQFSDHEFCDHACCMHVCVLHNKFEFNYRNIRRTTIRILAIHQLRWHGAERRGLLITLYTLAGTMLATGSWTSWVSVRLPTSVGQCMGWPTILLRWILFYAQPDQRTLSLFRPAPRVHPGCWGLSPATPFGMVSANVKVAPATMTSSPTSTIRWHTNAWCLLGSALASMQLDLNRPCCMAGRSLGIEEQLRAHSNAYRRRLAREY